MTSSFKLTVSGWLINAFALDAFTTSDFHQVEVIELFGVEFWADHQRLGLVPQRLLILVTPSLLANPFALGFLQYYRVTAELQTVRQHMPRAMSLVRTFRQKVVATENNWYDPTLKGRVRPDLIKLNQRLARLRRAFGADTLSFQQYQMAEWQAVNAVSTHLAAHLAGVQHHQRQLWGTLQAQLNREAQRQLLLINGRGHQEWTGPTTVTTTKTNGQLTFSRSSKLPTVHRRQLRDPTYRQTLLGPLQRGYADWLKAGQPLTQPTGLPVGLKQAFALWQDSQHHTAS